MRAGEFAFLWVECVQPNIFVKFLQTVRINLILLLYADWTVSAFEDLRLAVDLDLQGRALRFDLAAALLMRCWLSFCRFYWRNLYGIQIAILVESFSFNQVANFSWVLTLLKTEHSYLLLVLSSLTNLLRPYFKFLIYLLRPRQSCEINIDHLCLQDTFLQSLGWRPIWWPRLIQQIL